MIGAVEKEAARVDEGDKETKDQPRLLVRGHHMCQVPQARRRAQEVMRPDALRPVNNRGARVEGRRVRVCLQRRLYGGKVYCSRECQVEDWEDGHKHECVDVVDVSPTWTYQFNLFTWEVHEREQRDMAYVHCYALAIDVLRVVSKRPRGRGEQS